MAAGEAVVDPAGIEPAGTDPTRTDAAAGPRLGLITATLAFACGASVANLYYAQPLLNLVARSFHVGQGTATVVVTATQLGYALGLAFVLPLGDLLENRRLASRTLLGTAVVLVIAGSSPDLPVFLAASVLVGLTSVVAQVLVPLAAHLAPPAERGAFVGRVMSGLLLGILLARTVSSLVAAVAGWRTIYFVSAGLMLATSVLVAKVVPQRRPGPGPGYGALLRSIGELIRAEPRLRARACAQACMFSAFTAYWTAIAYELVDKHGFGQTGIAVFALVGAAGAMAAPLAGRIGDRGHGVRGRIAAGILGTIAMVIAALGSSYVVLLGLAGVLLDLAVQSHQVLSQRDIYGLREDARARINAAFMTTIFLTGAVSSVATGALHDAYGWTGVAVFAAVLSATATAIGVLTRKG